MIVYTNNVMFDAAGGLSSLLVVVAKVLVERYGIESDETLWSTEESVLRGEGALLDLLIELEGNEHPCACLSLHEHDRGIVGRTRQTDVALIADGATRVSVSIQVETRRRSALVPTLATVDTPPILEALLEHFPLVDWLTWGQPMLPRRDELAGLVSYFGSPVATSSSVLLFADPSGSYPMDPHRAARLLVGLAEVMPLPISLKPFALKRALTSRYYAPPGSVIVVRPRTIARADGDHVTRLAVPAEGASRPDPEALMQAILAHASDAQTVRLTDQYATPSGLRSRIVRDRRTRAHEARLADLSTSIDERLTEALEENARLLETNRQLARERHAREARDADVGSDPDALPPKGVMRDVFVKVADPFATPALSPHEALLALQARYPKNVLVLPEALKSARHRGARAFGKPAKVHDLLHRLVTAYRERLVDGTGDVDAKGVFTPAEFAAGESGRLSSGGQKRRRRVHDGRTYEMLRHLKIGTADGAGSFRIHFDWDARTNRVVIGHCGGHLDF